MIGVDSARMGHAKRGRAMSEELIGTISHYFAKPQVGIVKLTAGLKVGDTLRLSGHGAEFQQTVTSMQLNHAPVEPLRQEPKWPLRSNSVCGRAPACTGLRDEPSSPQCDFLKRHPLSPRFWP